MACLAILERGCTAGCMRRSATTRRRGLRLATISRGDAGMWMRLTINAHRCGMLRQERCAAAKAKAPAAKAPAAVAAAVC